MPHSRIIIDIEHGLPEHMNPGDDALPGVSEAFFNFGVGPDEDGERWIHMDGLDYTVVGWDVEFHTEPLNKQNRGF